MVKVKGGGRLIGDKGEGDETGSRKVNMGGPTLVGWSGDATIWYTYRLRVFATRKSVIGVFLGYRGLYLPLEVKVSNGGSVVAPNYGWLVDGVPRDR